MSKGKGPRKRKGAVSSESADRENLVEPQTQEKGELVPPARRPPTAVAAGTPPPPSPAPRPRAEVSERQRSPLRELVQAIRSVVGTMLDIADAAAEVITKRIEGRA